MLDHEVYSRVYFCNVIKTMEPKRIADKYRETALHLISEAKKYSPEEFAKSPAKDEWSMAQVYHHIALVTDQCLANAKLCAQGKGKRKSIAVGPAIFELMGSFPPIKLKIKKVPEQVKHLYHPENITIETAITRLEQSIRKMDTAIPMIDKADKSMRAEHWAGGWFNARQWYHSAEMHIRHHLRQKKRLDKFLGKL